MKVTIKGQVTIPQAVRERFGLTPGTDVEFVTLQNQVVLRARRKRKSPADEWLGEAVGVAKGRTSTAAVMKETRGED